MANLNINTNTVSKGLGYPIEYNPMGSILEISNNVVFNSTNNVFVAKKDVTAFFFIDNGFNMTAYYNGVSWAFFYVKYGKLYNWYAVETSRTGINSFTSSDDWRVATSSDWVTLTDYCIASDESITSVNVGNYLKSRRQDGSPLGGVWDTTEDPRWLINATHYGLDFFRFGASGTGTRSGSSGLFQDTTLRTNRMTPTESGIYAVQKYLRYNTGDVASFNGFKTNGSAVNIIRDATIEEQLLPDGSVVDAYYQNNGYPLKCVKIGTQVWTSEVFETNWRNGDIIETNGASGVFSDAEWAALTTPGVCNYNNDETLSYFISYAPLFDKYTGNPILTKGESGTWESQGVRSHTLLVDPSGDAVVEDGKYIMYYNGRLESSNVTKIGRATSVDMVNWTKEEANPLLEDGTYAALGSVIKRGVGDYICIYGYDSATKFNYATSTDGLTWSINAVGVPILSITDIPGGISMGQLQVTEIGGTQYMVFEVSEPNFYICMAKSTNWTTWNVVGQIYTATSGYFDDANQANPSLYKVEDNYYIIIYNGNPGGSAWDLGIIHSNSIETGWEKLQNAPVLNRGINGKWDDARLEGGRMYRDQIANPRFKMYYFGLPTTDSFLNGAIGLSTLKKGVSIEYKTV